MRIPHETISGCRVQEVREYATTTPALLGLTDWLRCQQVDLVAMEATSSYWKPVFYLLEAEGFECWLLQHPTRQERSRPAEDRQAGHGMAGQSRRAGHVPTQPRCNPKPFGTSCPIPTPATTASAPAATRPDSTTAATRPSMIGGNQGMATLGNSAPPPEAMYSLMPLRPEEMRARTTVESGRALLTEVGVHSLSNVRR